MFSWLSFNCAKVHLSKRLMSCSLSQAPLEFLFRSCLLSSFLSNELCSGSCEAQKASHVPSRVCLHAVRRSYFHMLCRLLVTRCASEIHLRNISISALLRSKTWYSWCLLSILALCYKRVRMIALINGKHFLSLLSESSKVNKMFFKNYYRSQW